MPYFNHFTEPEQPYQARFKHQRDVFFGPIVSILTKLRISADMVSGTGVLCLVPFGVLLCFYPPTTGVMTAAVILLALHVLFDGIDGSIARRLGQDGPSGALVDMTCDHCGMVIVSLFFGLAGLAEPNAVALYIVTYTIMIVLMVWLNALDRPFRWVFRTKFVLYALFLLEVVTDVNVLTVFMLAATVYHLGPIFLGFHRLRQELQKPRQA